MLGKPYMFNFFTTLVDKSEIESIVNTALDNRSKRMVGKIFHNPQLSEHIFYIMLLITLVLCMILAFTSTSYNSDNFFIDSLLNTMNCESLKDLHTSLDLTYSQEKQVTKYMLIQCL